MRKMICAVICCQSGTSFFRLTRISSTPPIDNEKVTLEWVSCKRGCDSSETVIDTVIEDATNSYRRRRGAKRNEFLIVYLNKTLQTTFSLYSERHKDCVPTEIYPTRMIRTPVIKMASDWSIGDDASGCGPSTFG